MQLFEAVAKLSTLVPQLKANDAKFASDLIASYKKYGSLTYKQTPWIYTLITRAEATKVAPVVMASAEPVNVGTFDGVIALFNKAKEHLKFPKVHLMLGGQKVVLALNGAKSKAPGSVSVMSEGNYKTFLGRVSPEGTFTGAYSLPAETKAALVDLLTKFSAHPARVAQEHGKLTGNCCFCHKELGLGEDKRSVAVGFGPICAEHYGLKEQWLTGAAKAAVKASVAQEPTLTVSEGAQEAIASLADSLVTATGAVAVTVTDGPYHSVAVTPVTKLVEDTPAFSVVASWPPFPQVALDAVQSAPSLVDEVVDAAAALQAEIEADQAKNDADKAQGMVDAAVQAYVEADTAAVMSLQAEMDADEVLEALSHLCFFCEEPSSTLKTLHGIHVCPVCVQALVAE